MGLISMPTEVDQARLLKTCMKSTQQGYLDLIDPMDFTNNNTDNNEHDEVNPHHSTDILDSILMDGVPVSRFFDDTSLVDASPSLHAGSYNNHYPFPATTTSLVSDTLLLEGKVALPAVQHTKTTSSPLSQRLEPTTRGQESPFFEGCESSEEDAGEHDGMLNLNDLDILAIADIICKELDTPTSSSDTLGVTPNFPITA